MDWDKTEAFKVGLIDENGKLLHKPTTTEEKEAYTLFHRIVFNFKRIVTKLPGSKFLSYASALYLLKAHTEYDEEQILEAVKMAPNLTEASVTFDVLENRRYQLNKDIFIPSPMIYSAAKGSTVTILESLGIHFGVEMWKARHVLSEQECVVSVYDLAADLQQEEFQFEDATTTANIPSVPMPLKHDSGASYQKFKVPTDVYRRFDCGRKPYQRWSQFFDLTNETQSQIASFARKYREALIILEDETTGAMRAVRRTSSDGK